MRTGTLQKNRSSLLTFLLCLKLVLAGCPASKALPQDESNHHLKPVMGGPGSAHEDVFSGIHISQALAADIFVLARVLQPSDLAPHSDDSKSVAALRHELALTLPDIGVGKTISSTQIEKLKNALLQIEKTAPYASQNYFDARLAYIDFINILNVDIAPKSLVQTRDKTSKRLYFSRTEPMLATFDLKYVPLAQLAEKDSHTYILEYPKRFLAYRNFFSGDKEADLEATSFDPNLIVPKYRALTTGKTQDATIQDQLALEGTFELSAIAAIVYTGTSTSQGLYSAYIKRPHGWIWARADHPAEPVDWAKIPANTYFSSVIYETHEGSFRPADQNGQPVQDSGRTHVPKSRTVPPRRKSVEYRFSFPADKNKKPKIAESVPLDFAAELPHKQAASLPSTMYIVIGGDEVQFLPTEDVIEKHFEATKDKESTHVFIDPQNTSQFADLNGNHAHIHTVSENNLANAIRDAVTAKGPDNIVFFFIAHGLLGNGNLCYKSKSSCTLGMSQIWDILRNLEHKSTPKPPKKVLLVPFSCFNGILADSLLSFAAKQAPLEFPVAIVHSADHKKASNWDMPVLIAMQSIAYSGFHRPETFQDWVSQGDRLHTLQHLNTLNQWVQLSNSLRPTWSADYKISHFAGHALNAGDVPLKDFGFKPNFQASVSLANSKIGPGSKTLQEIIDAVFPTEMRSWVRTLEFRSSD
jgi:hypothetical protein